MLMTVGGDGIELSETEAADHDASAIAHAVDAPPRVGRFEIRSRLGSGGMGVVYEAHDPLLERSVAVKLLSPGLSSGGSQQRLLREAQAMASLKHRNVVTVHEVGQAAGNVFVAMELIEGGSLRGWSPDGWRDALQMYLQAGAGLAAAHRAGLVHRDFKPDNVLVADDGTAKVSDFGLVRSVTQRPDGTSAVDEDASLHVSLTKTGAIMGTPAYMSPEQLTGGNVDARSDQFSFCVSLYEALYGVRPYAGDDFASLSASILEGRRIADPDSEVPAWVAAILHKGIATNPAERYESMDALLAALADDPSARRRRRVAVGLGVGVLLAAGIAVLVTWRGRVASEQRARREAQRAQRERQRTQVQAQRARDATLLAAARKWGDERFGNPLIAAAMLREVADPSMPGWLQLASEVLARNLPEHVFRFPGKPARAHLSADHKWLVAGDVDQPRFAVVDLSGTAEPRVIAAPAAEGPIIRTWFVAGDRLVTLSVRGALRSWPARPGLGAASTLVWASKAERRSRAATLSDDRTLLAVATVGGDVMFARCGADGVSRLPDRGVEMKGGSTPWARLALSPDKRWAAVGKGPQVWLYPLSGRGAPRKLRGHRRPVTQVVFSRSGGVVVSADQGGEVRLWHVADERPPIVLHQTGQVLVAVSPDGTWVATVVRNKGLRLWDGETGEQRWYVSDAVGEPRFGPEGRFLAFRSDRRGVSVRRVELASPGSFSDFVGHSNSVNRILLTRDGRVVTVSNDRRICVWRRDPQRHTQQVSPTAAVGVAVSEDGRYVVTSSFRAPRPAYRVWALHGTRLERLDEIPTSEQAVFAANGTVVTVRAKGRSARQQIQVWSLKARNLLHSWRNDGMHLRAVTADGQHLIFAAGIPPKASVRLQPIGGGPAVAVPGMTTGKEWIIAAFGRSAATLQVVVRLGYNRIAWLRRDAPGKRRVLALPASLTSAGISHDGERLALALTDDTLRLWNWSGQRTRDLPAQGSVFAPAWSADDRLIAGTFTQLVGVWRTRGAAQPIILGHRCQARAAALVPGRQRLLATCDDGTVHIIPFYGVEPARLMAALWRRSAYCLTSLQRQRLLGEEPQQANTRAHQCQAHVVAARR